MPIFILGVFSFLLFCYFVMSFLLMESTVLRIVSLVEVVAAAWLFLWSYLGTVCRDPGFLPFDWAATRRTKYSWTDLMAGTVTNEEQLSYVTAVPRPPGCSFSRQSGRYVIRADHICPWVSNWVAKRNHKHFLLFMVWGGVYALSLFAWGFAPRREGVEWVETVGLIGMILAAFFGIVMLACAATFLVDALSNRTTIQRMKGEGAAAQSRMDAMRQICGDGNVCGWLCPTDAFGETIVLEEGDQQGNLDQTEVLYTFPDGTQATGDAILAASHHLPH